MPQPKQVERTDLATLVADMRAWGPGAVAVVEHRGVRRYTTTYGELATLAHRFAAELDRRQISAGERVVIWGANSAEWIAAFFGCVLRGVLPVPLDATGTQAFAESIVREVAPKLVCGDRVLLASLQQDHLPHPFHPLHEREALLAFDGFRERLPQESMREAALRLTPETPLQILFTSGTTGSPKGIVQTHGNLLASLLPIEREIAKYRRYERWVHPLRILHTLPLSHVFGQFMGLWLPPLLGASVIYESRSNGARLGELIPWERANVLAAVPRTLELLSGHLLAEEPWLADATMKAQGERIARRWWRFRRVHRRLGLRFWAAVCGGATLTAELERFWTTLGFALVQGYGLTETAALVTLNHPFKIARGSLGKALPGRTLRLSSTGELEVKGEMVATARWESGRMVNGGSRGSEDGSDHDEHWLATGDLARIEPDGQVRFLGRTGQRLVTAAGLNVYLQDVEQALEQQTQVQEALVFVLKEKQREEPAAVVVAMGGQAEARAAMERANASLAPHQRCTRWWLWPGIGLPRTASGKVKRSAIEQWALGQLQAERVSGAAGFAENGNEAAGSDPAVSLLRQISGQTISGQSAASRKTTDDARLDEDWGLDSMGRVALAAALDDMPGMADKPVEEIQTLGELRGCLRGSASGKRIVPAADSSRMPARDDAAAHRTELLAADAEAVESRRGKGADARMLRAESLFHYRDWPYAAPIVAAQAAFRELLLRPLVALLADPSVEGAYPGGGSGPLLLICNHRSAIDVPLLLSALPYTLRRRVVVAMSGEMLAGWQQSWKSRTLSPALEQHRRWWGPPAAFLLTVLFHVFPLPRTQGFRRSFAYAGRALDRGYNVLIFPEGRRSPDDAMLPFKPGLGILAKEAGVAVLPLALSIRLDQNRSWLHSQTCVGIGHAVTIDPAMQAVEITQLLESTVSALLVERCAAASVSKRSRGR